MSSRPSQEHDLFDNKFAEDIRRNAPLADRLRPTSLDDFVGQKDIIGKKRPLRTQIENDQLASLVFWGPPGTGKTSLAKIIAETTQATFVPLSAIGFTTKNFREKVAEATDRRKLHGQRTILFIDEIHRLNKSQQDQLLPYLEKGLFVLIGATTENPSFSLNSAIISRSQVYVLKNLEADDLKKLIKKALTDEGAGLGIFCVKINPKAEKKLIQMANGDARILLNLLERAVFLVGKKGEITEEKIEEISTGIALRYDRVGEEHYNLISALHKSMRDGDANAALYWLGRMIAGGEDPLYIIRRVVRFASEDVGMADPQALLISVAAKQTIEFVGLPEANCALGQAVAYCAKAPKSNAVYKALNKINAEISESGNLPVPMHIRNAPTNLMKEIGYGKGYKYFHDDPKGGAEQEHLPDEIKNKKFLEE